MERLEKAGVKFAAAIPTQSSPLLTFLLTWILPILIFAALGQFMMRKLQSGGIGSNAMSFGKANAKVYVEAQTGKTFADVAGEDEAKEALTEIVDFLHNPGHRQDAACQGGCGRSAGAVLLYLRIGICGNVRGHGRRQGARPVPAGQ